MTGALRTAAGRALLADIVRFGATTSFPAWHRAILAIEAEATDQAMLDAFDDVQRMDRAEAAAPDPVASPPEAVRLLRELVDVFADGRGSHSPKAGFCSLTDEGHEAIAEARRYLAATAEGTP